jgi:hypothetical protein
MLNVIILNFVEKSVITLSVIVRNIVGSSVVMLRVVAPFGGYRQQKLTY